MFVLLILHKEAHIGLSHEAVLLLKYESDRAGTPRFEVHQRGASKSARDLNPGTLNDEYGKKYGGPRLAPWSRMWPFTSPSPWNGIR